MLSSRCERKAFKELLDKFAIMRKTRALRLDYPQKLTGQECSPPLDWSERLMLDFMSFASASSFPKAEWTAQTAFALSLRLGLYPHHAFEGARNKLSFDCLTRAILFGLGQIHQRLRVFLLAVTGDEKDKTMQAKPRRFLF
jgi:hypothetical protein